LFTLGRKIRKQKSWVDEGIEQGLNEHLPLVSYFDGALCNGAYLAPPLDHVSCCLGPWAFWVLQIHVNLLFTV